MTEVQLVERGPVRIYTPGVARAMLRHESQRVALADRLRARWQESEREKRHAAGLSLRMALDMSAASSVGGALRWADYFPGALQVVQSDLGITYGSVLSATGVTPPAVGLSGSTLAAALPIRVTTSAGILGVSTYNLYHDSVGTALAQTGTTAASVPINALPGLSVTFPNSTYFGSDVYLATCAGLADQSGNGKHYSQAAATQQPIIVLGPNGKIYLQYNGISTASMCLDSALNLVAPGTAPFSVLLVGRLSPITGSSALVNASGAANCGLIYVNVPATGLGQYNATATAFVINSMSGFTRVRAYYSNSASDAIKVGSNPDSSGTSCGNNTSTGRRIGANWGTGGNAINGSKLDFLGAVHVLGQISPGQLANFDAALNSSGGYAGAVQV